MKIYLFNAETGFYLGEDFAEDLSMCLNEAGLPHATMIEPPSFRRGEVPVFVVAENKWEIRSIPAAQSECDGDSQENRLPGLRTFRPASRQEDD